MYGGHRLLELAAEKDRGFTVPTFVDALRMIRRITPERSKAAGVSADQAARIERTVQAWCAELVDRS